MFTEKGLQLRGAMLYCASCNDIAPCGIGATFSGEDGCVQLGEFNGSTFINGLNTNRIERTVFLPFETQYSTVQEAGSPSLM